MTFIEVDFTLAVLGGCDLRRVDLSDCRLREASLVGADLRKAVLRRADLSGARAQDARLDEADLRGARIDPTFWTTAKLRGAKIDIEQALAYAAAHGLDSTASNRRAARHRALRLYAMSMHSRARRAS